MMWSKLSGHKAHILFQPLTFPQTLKSYTVAVITSHSSDHLPEVVGLILSEAITTRNHMPDERLSMQCSLMFFPPVIFILQTIIFVFPFIN